MTTTKHKPRVLKFKTEADLLDDVRRLRRGCVAHGNWSLAQTCWHLRNAIDATLVPPSTTQQTPEQQKAMPVFLALVQHGFPAEEVPTPAGLVPPSTGLISSELDALIQAIEKLSTYTASHGQFGAAGPVPFDHLKKFHLVHAAHHLGYFMPAMPPRKLVFNDVDAVIAEVNRLRTGGYRKSAEWSLPQICGHLAAIVESAMTPPAEGVVATPEQTARQTGFMKTVHEGKSGKFTAPPSAVPSPDAGDDQIDRFIAAMQKLKTFPHKQVVMGGLGPAPFDEVKPLHLKHAAHHLGFLIPNDVKPREGLSYASTQAVIDDIENLRKGYIRTGNWTLAQACAHIAETTERRMVPPPFPPNTPEQDARKPILEMALASGKLPTGTQAPDFATPAPDTTDAAIDRCIAALRKFDAHPGPFAPHRVFGHLPDADLRKLNLIHAAHHLSRLVPTSEASK